MNDNLVKLVARAVTENIIFAGAVGTGYTVQDLIHGANLTTIKNMGQRIEKELKTSFTESRFSSGRTTKKESDLKFKLEILGEVYDYRKDLAKAERDAEKLKAEAAEKLAVLSKIKTEKELEALNKMSIEDIEKEIEKYS